MKLPTWSEFLAIFAAAFITALSIHLLWGSYSRAHMAHTKPLFAPIMLDKTTQLGP
jgi:TRAP-type C4-dicarboxylate transport system permease small subunit